jgi:hypothetical protein
LDLLGLLSVIVFFFALELFPLVKSRADKAEDVERSVEKKTK